MAGSHPAHGAMNRHNAAGDQRLAGAIEDVLPAGSRQLPSAALGYLGGDEEEEEEAAADATLSQERYAEMSAVEEFILTLSERGYGKRTSSFEYRVTGRGGKGIVAMRVNERNGTLVASFPVEDDDQIMLVTNAGQLIRVPVDGIRIVGRSTAGVTVFDTAEGENVVSVERISDTGEEEDEENGKGDSPDAGDDNGTGDGAPDA